MKTFTLKFSYHLREDETLIADWAVFHADDAGHAYEQLADELRADRDPPEAFIETWEVDEELPYFEVGSRVFWHDPEDEICSGYGTVVKQISHAVILISKDDGGEVEAFVHECSSPEVCNSMPKR